MEIDVFCTSGEVKMKFLVTLGDQEVKKKLENLRFRLFSFAGVYTTLPSSSLRVQHGDASLALTLAPGVKKGGNLVAFDWLSPGIAMQEGYRVNGVGVRNQNRRI